MRIDILRRLDAQHLRPEGGVEKDEFRRHQPGLDDLLVVIDVVEEDVDRLHPLNAAPLDQVPFGAVEDARDQVERDQPLGRAAFGIDGEGDAEPAKQLLGRVLLGDERFDREIVEQAGKRGVSGLTLPSGARISSKNWRESSEGSLSPRLDTHPLEHFAAIAARPSSPKTAAPQPRRVSSDLFSGILCRCRAY